MKDQAELKGYYFKGDGLIGPKIISALTKIGVDATSQITDQGTNKYKIYYIITFKNRLTLFSEKCDSTVGKSITMSREAVTMKNLTQFIKLTEQVEIPKSKTSSPKPKTETPKIEKKESARRTLSIEEQQKFIENALSCKSLKELADKWDMSTTAAGNRIQYFKKSGKLPVDLKFRGKTKREGLKLIPLDEAISNSVGKEGTSERKKFDEEVQKELEGSKPIKDYAEDGLKEALNRPTGKIKTVNGSSPKLGPGTNIHSNNRPKIEDQFIKENPEFPKYQGSPIPSVITESGLIPTNDPMANVVKDYNDKLFTTAKEFIQAVLVMGTDLPDDQLVNKCVSIADKLINKCY